MNLKDVKNWINSLPEEFLDFEVVNIYSVKRYYK